MKPDRFERVRKRAAEIFQDCRSCSDFCFDNLVTAFRIDISPDLSPIVKACDKLNANLSSAWPRNAVGDDSRR